jgi:hypothetical protein
MNLLSEDQYMGACEDVVSENAVLGAIEFEDSLAIKRCNNEKILALFIR